jgi:hypothetical protein
MPLSSKPCVVCTLFALILEDYVGVSECYSDVGLFEEVGYFFMFGVQYVKLVHFLSCCLFSEGVLWFILPLNFSMMDVEKLLLLAILRNVCHSASFLVAERGRVVMRLTKYRYAAILWFEEKLIVVSVVVRLR